MRSIKWATTLYEDALNRRTDTDKRDIQTATQLDPLGRVVSVTRAVGTPDEATLETNEYDGNSNQELTTDAEGRQTRFAYDAANRLEERTDGLGTPVAAVTRFRYDGVGNVLEELDARAAVLGEPWSIERTYDVPDRLKTEANGEGNLTVYGYDEEGNRTSVQEPAGQVTSFAYGELVELLEVTQAIPEPGEAGAGDGVRVRREPEPRAPDGRERERRGDGVRRLGPPGEDDPRTPQASPWSPRPHASTRTGTRRRWWIRRARPPPTPTTSSTA